jgi:hypothetical protein
LKSESDSLWKLVFLHKYGHNLEEINKKSSLWWRDLKSIASLPEGVGWAGLMKIKEMSWRRVEDYRF